MFNKISLIAQSAWYWLLLMSAGIASEGLALYYQYTLDIRPCVLCIQTRIWLAVLILVASAALLARHSKKLLILAHVLTTIIMAGLLERSYQLLSIERGWAFGSCDFDLGLPQWLALEKWFPTVFKVWESCGYTPELLFNVTMAEALIVSSGIMLFVSLSMTIAACINKK